MSLRDFGWGELRFLLLSVRWTVLLALIAFAGGGTIGLLVAALRVAPSRLGRWAMDAYITVFQGTPLLVQLLLFYYGSSFLGFTPDALVAAALTFTLNSASFFGEIWRGCIEAVPRGQWDAAEALGLRYLPALRLVVLPQALRVAVAPTIGYMVQVVKATSVASLIGITEITRSAVMVNTVTFDPTRVFGTVCAVYFAICWPLSYASERLSRRLDRSGHGTRGIAALRQAGPR
ncbi:MAG: amino acid ABC transporter permease [Pseudomonadota bacterium]|nr:amino acid ABC transporter permease [Pseudomonadota bacterium]